MNRLRLWTFLFTLTALIPFNEFPASAQPPSGGSLSAGTTSPRDLSVAPDLGLKLKDKVLDVVHQKMAAGVAGAGPKFPYLDHRPHETAEKLSKILAEAAIEAAKRTADDKGGQITEDFRAGVGQKIDALLKESSGRESDWRWLVNEATNIDRRIFLEAWSKNPDKTSPDLKPNLTRWSHLAYI
ncbi:MAG: hypothetical protein WCJ09_00510 [Planctomycetota bacterium]